MNQDTYTRTLESLLIFMCQTYEENQKALLDLYKKEGNVAFEKVPMIQGTANSIGISKIADLPFEEPTIGFYEMANLIKSKGNNE